MDEQFKEIEGLLENVEQVQQRSFKKYAKLIIPHVALVTAVCLYAMCGAFLFYTLESPHEDMLKKNGVKRISDKRQVLTRMMFEARKRDSVRVWMEKTESELLKFNEELYRAFKDEYVRYSDVRVKAIPGQVEPRSKRHRKSKSRTEKSEKMWTGSSALFFAATTMATIGYGNIVPVTPYGRITCVIFALFGAPLAIITIGDLGKFLSECTIWLYKKLRKMRKFLNIRYKRWRLRKSGVVIEADEDSSSHSSRSRLEWDDLSMDKTEVPVLLVFAILLLYIAFGGVLFAFLESWTYMDAFYYCFVSLTTIGFGDIVPERHEYIVIMLVYLGVGLAVTTMCIDLVGIQYIQKIHYFGRKFRGTDLLHLLKRKRMLERRLAMGQGEEILQMYLQQMTQERQEFRPPPILIADQCYTENEDEKYSLRSDRKLPSRQTSFAYNLLDEECEELLHKFVGFGTLANVQKRIAEQSRRSWNESGPDVSIHCSLSPSPSIQQRQQMYDNYRSPDPSVLSFEYQFRLPSPDLKEIAEKARSARRNLSCPSSFGPVISPRVPPLSPITPTPMGMACMEEWDSYIRMLDEYCKPFVSPKPPEVVIEQATQQEESVIFDQILEEPEPSPSEEIISHLAKECFINVPTCTTELIEIPSMVKANVVDIDTDFEGATAQEVIQYHFGTGAVPIPVYCADSKPFDLQSALENTVQCPVKYLSKVPPSMVTDNYCFVVDGDIVSLGEITQESNMWWKDTSNATKYYSSEDLMKTFHQISVLTSRGEIRSAYRAQKKGGGMQNVTLEKVFKVQRYFSYWKSCKSFHRIISVVSPVTKEGEQRSGFQKRIFIQYLWRTDKQSDRQRVANEYILQSKTRVGSSLSAASFHPNIENRVRR